MRISFKQARSIGLSVMVIVTIFVGLIPTFNMLELKAPFNSIKNQIRWMETLAVINNDFNEGKRLYDLYLIREIDTTEESLAKLLLAIEGGKLLKNKIQNTETNIFLENFIKDVMKFRVSLILCQKALEIDPTADTALMMERNTIVYGKHAQDSLSDLTAQMRNSLSLEHDKIGRILSKSRMVSLSGLFIGILLSIFVAIILSKALGRPLKTLVTISKKLARGEMDVRLDMQNDPEFQGVADAFNKMTGDLKTYIGQLNQANQKANEMAEKADAASKAKSEFLANMSHEIRTPMNGVIAATDLALAEELDPEIERYLRIIHDSGYSLLKVINDILDFSKIESGHLEIEEAPFSLDDTIAQIVEMFASNALNKEVELRTKIEPNLPKTIVGDSIRLRQIITNIVGNAIKFTDSGDTITIDIGQKSSAKNTIMLEFYVKDTGTGIKTKHLEKLFDPFIQADTSATRHYGGTGLGLTISKKLIEKMNGEIQVKSEYGKGTTVHFTCLFGLEVKEPRQIEKPKSLTESKAVDYKKKFMGLNILVAEDNPVNQEIIKIILSKANLNTEIVGNGKDALEALKKTKFDAILMDIQMPEMDGFKATKCIRNDAENRTLPIIALTANAMKGAEEKCLSAGMDGYIGKPINQEKLFRTLWEAIKSKTKGTTE